MEIITEYMGEVAYSEEDIVTLEKGLYGFESEKRFLVLKHPNPKLPYMWLQSLDNTEVCFIVTDPFNFVENYDFDLDDEIAERLELATIEQVLVLTMVVIPEEVKNTTINLQSPIIINKSTQHGEQVILNERFPLKHKLFTEGVE